MIQMIKNSKTLIATTKEIQQVILDNRELLPNEVRAAIATGHNVQFQILATFDSTLNLDFSESSEKSAFNPVEGMNATEVLSLLQSVVDVELSPTKYILAKDGIQEHLAKNKAPSIRSVLDSLEDVSELKDFAAECKRLCIPN